MEAISYTTARQKLETTLDRVVDDRNPVTIVRQRGGPVVVMSLDDYNNIMEKVHLVSGSKNAGRSAEGLDDRAPGASSSHEG